MIHLNNCSLYICISLQNIKDTISWLLSVIAALLALLFTRKCSSRLFPYISRYFTQFQLLHSGISLPVVQYNVEDFFFVIFEIVSWIINWLFFIVVNGKQSTEPGEGETCICTITNKLLTFHQLLWAFYV